MQNFPINSICVLVSFKIWMNVVSQATVDTDDVRISLEGSTAVVTAASLNQMTTRRVSVSRITKCTEDIFLMELFLGITTCLISKNLLINSQ